jgi:hypothetical protein
MRKHLLFLAMLALAVTATAQLRYSDLVKASVPEPQTIDMTNMPLATATFDTEAVPGAQQAPTVKENLPKAWYNRPAGAFWGASTTIKGSPKTSAPYAPYLHLTPYFESTFVNASEDAERYEWEYETRQYVSGTGWVYTWYTSEDENLTVPYRNEIDTVPALSAFNADGGNKYQPGGGKVASGEITEWHLSTALAKPDYSTAYSNTAEKTLWYTPKFWGHSTNRDGTALAGGYYSSGALDAAGGNTGRWYGRNWQNINHLGVAFEKPEHPYVLRKVGVRYQQLKLVDVNKKTTVYVKVYRIDEMKPYQEDRIEGAIIPDEENLIAQGTCEVDTTYEGSGLFEFPLFNYDGDLPYEVQPEIDFPILVTFTGYNTDDFTETFTLLYSSDQYDEGHGEHVYLGQTQEDGEVVYFGNYSFFTNKKTRGISIYIDAVRPFMVWNYSDETGEYTFADEGESYAPEIYTYENMDLWEVSDADADDPENCDLPEWLNVELAYGLDDDGEEDETIVIPTITAAPLPEGVDYRECNIKFTYPGASLIFKAMQGEKSDFIKGDVNGDGKVNVTDVTTLVNMILSVIEKDMVKGDINGDGKINVTDVTALINIILGVTA